MRIKTILLSFIPLLLALSCDDEPSKSKLPEVAGVILDESSQEPIENVTITGFKGGVYTNNVGMHYGQPVILGVSDNCGRFKINLEDSITGSGAHGTKDHTLVVLRLSREDFGTKRIEVKFENSTQSITMKYGPIPKPFFKNLFFVQSEDRQSVTISWNIYSLSEHYTCPPPWGGPCINNSRGTIFIGRSDSGAWRYSMPIQLKAQQTVVDDELPAGDFHYNVSVGDTDLTNYHAVITRTIFDTLFLIESFKSPILNHCN